MEHSKAVEEAQRSTVLLRSHVERCLQDIRGTSELVADADGDFPFRKDTAMCCVYGGETPHEPDLEAQDQAATEGAA